MKLLNRMKKQAAIGMIAVMALSMSVTTMANDYTNHWAKDVITEWTGYGVIGGYEDGSFKPNSPMTRAEFAVILTNIFGLEATSESITFSDVNANAWYYNAINKVATAGMMQGGNGKFNPNATITRQEVAVAMAKAYHLTLVADKAVTFKDANDIAAWAKDAVAILASHGYISGRADGKFDPTANITRAEVMKMTDNIVAVYINKPGTYTTLAEGNVVVACKDVVLKNVTVTGNLYLAQGIVASEVVLDNATIQGSTYDVAGTTTTPTTADTTDTTTPATGGTGGAGGTGGNNNNGTAGDDSSTPSPYITVSSVKVGEVEVLGKGISVYQNKIEIDINKLVDNYGQSTIADASAKVTNLKDNTVVKVTAQIGNTAITQTREVKAGALNYTVRDGSSLLGGKYNAITGALKDLNLLDACEDVAQKVGYNSLQELLATRDSLNVAKLQDGLNKLVALYDAKDENTMKVVDYLHGKGIYITNSSFSYSVQVTADGLDTRSYTINVTF